VSDEMLTPFCEILTKKILPVIRFLVARELIEEYNLTQLETARLLGVSQPLLNYYLTGRRKVKYLDKLSKVSVIVEQSKRVAKAIANGEFDKVSICTVCKTLHAHAPEILRELNMDMDNVLLNYRE